MKFKDQEHEDFYDRHTASLGDDPYRKALFYTLGISEPCRRNVGRLYDFEERCLKPEGLYDGFQTSTSARVTRLAFNLFNDGTPSALQLSQIGKNEDAYLEAARYSPADIFCCSEAPYFFEAIKTRYPEYTREAALPAPRLAAGNGQQHFTMANGGLKGQIDARKQQGGGPPQGPEKEKTNTGPPYKPPLSFREKMGYETIERAFVENFIPYGEYRKELAKWDSEARALRQNAPQHSGSETGQKAQKAAAR